MFEPENNFYSRFKEFLESPAYFEDMWERKENYETARNFISSEEKIDKLTVENIFFLLRLFHSGGVERHRGNIALKIQEFKKLIAATLETCQDKTDSAFEKTKTLLDNSIAKVAGAGRNVISEIFHTYDPVRFPILNKNFEEDLLYFGFIKEPFKGSFGEKYYQCIKLSKEIREKFQIESCQVLDCFFNYVYWQNKKKFSPKEYEAWIKTKRRRKKKYLKISDKTMQTFEIEFYPIQSLPENLLKEMQQVLASYDQASLSSFSNLVGAYNALAEKYPTAKIKKHLDLAILESSKNTIFYQDRLNPTQLQKMEGLIKSFLEDVKKTLNE